MKFHQQVRGGSGFFAEAVALLQSDVITIAKCEMPFNAKNPRQWIFKSMI